MQRQLEDLGVPYTGSGPEACGLAMSKSASKRRFVECGVPTLPWIAFDAHDALVEPVECVAPLGYPLVLKPDAQGSSLGVVVVESSASLLDAVDAAGAYDGMVIAEPQVIGREFTIAVLGERTLPILEIVAPQRIFSYDAKYVSPQTQYRFDFELATSLRAGLLIAAAGAARALSTRGLVRVDLLLGSDERIWVLEVNTTPGMTQRSLAPLAAERAGLPMIALCEELLLLSRTMAEVA